MIISEIIETGLLSDKSSYYELSILVGVDSFVFVVFDEQNRLLALKHWHFEKFSSYRIEHYEMAFRNEPILNLTFRKVNIGIRNKRYTLVPSKLYNEQEKESYLLNLADFSNKDLIFTDRIPNENICNVFAFPEDIFQFFKSKYPIATLYHSTTPLVHAFSKYVKNRPGDHILVNFRPEELDILALKNGKIRLLNSFPINEGRDNLYFILLIFEQFGLKQNLDTVYMTGQINPHSEEFRQIKRYLPNVKIFELFDNVRTGDKFKKQQNKHQYFDILSFNSYIHDSDL